MAHLTNRTKFYLGTTLDADTIQEFAGDTYVEIKRVYDIGDFGDTHEAVEDSYIGSDRVIRMKGTADGGVLDLIVTRDPSDAGQAALAAATKVDSDYNIKVVLPDKKTANGNGTTFYFRANVMGGRLTMGETNNVVRSTWNLAINSDRYEVAAT